MFGLTKKRIIDRVDPPIICMIKCEPKDIFCDDGQSSNSTSTCIKREPKDEFGDRNCVSEPRRSDTISFETIPKQEQLFEEKFLQETSPPSGQHYNLRIVSEDMGDSLDNKDSSNSDYAENCQLNIYRPEHSSPKPSTSTDELLDFKCEFCSKTYTTMNSLENHIIDIHVVDKEFHCSKCSRAFISQEKLDSHIVSAHQRLKCSYCPKTYRLEEKFLEHLEKHEQSGGRLYKCLTCGKGFIRSYQLTRHEMIHTNQKPHKCHLCPKSFVSLGRLQGHLANSHNEGKKRYKCPVCSKAFYHQGDLIRNHLPRHSEERNFHCDKCVKSFKTKSGVITHRIICHGAKKHIKT